MFPAEKTAGLSRRLRVPATGFAALLLCAAVAAADDKAAAAAAKLAEVKAQTQGAAPAAPAAVPAPPEDNRPWLTDEKTGRRYRIESIPKVEGTYRWMNENEVRFPGGAVLEVVDHDDKSFRVKAYEIKRDDGQAVAQAPKPQVDPAKVAEAYKFTLGEADRVTLVPFDAGLPQRGQWRNGFDLADTNKDGNLDIVFGPARKGRQNPNIFLGDGKGNWAINRDLRYPQQAYDYGDVAVGDFNGDGKFDLAFGVHLKGMLVLVNDGQGGFTPWTKGIEFDVPGQGGDASSFSSRAIGVIDWNLDGKLDVIAIGEGPKGLKTNPGQKDKTPLNIARGIRVYLNQGDGTWVPQESSLLDAQRPNFGDSFAVADFDRDGDNDVFAGTRQLGNNILFGRRSDKGLIDFEPFDVRPRGLVNAVVARDLDGDGWIDLALGYQSNEVAWRSGVDVFWGGKDGFKRQTVFNRENRDGVTALDAGDIDGDGKLDLVSVDQAARVRILLNDGKRGWLEEKNVGELPPERNGCAGWMVRLADMNGDHRDEIVISFAGEPGGYPGMAELSTAGCKDEGSINVYSPRPKG